MNSGQGKQLRPGYLERVLCRGVWRLPKNASFCGFPEECMHAGSVTREDTEEGSMGERETTASLSTVVVEIGSNIDVWSLKVALLT